MLCYHKVRVYRIGHRRIEELVNREEIFDWDGRAFIRVWEHAEKNYCLRNTRGLQLALTTITAKKD